MAKKPKHPVDQALERLREQLPVKPSAAPGSGKKEKHDIVSPRDERGIPYPGDFPNPASDRTRGCF
jgi:hypothetical protein